MNVEIDRFSFERHMIYWHDTQSWFFVSISIKIERQFSSSQTNDDAALNTRTSVLAYDDINDEEGDDTPVDVHGSRKEC